MAAAAEYREKAAQCHRLAEAITARDDPAIAALLKLAAEYEANAVAIEAGVGISAPPEEGGRPLSDN
jgi:hypothetical protein